MNMGDSEASKTNCIIDHIVLLVSTEDFEAPPPWLSDNFTILDGGNHEGQASRNKLIVFKDGTYLELFNWYDKPPDDDAEERPMKVWGKKKPGLIDFALSSVESPAESYVGGVNARLKENGGDGGLGVRYGQPTAGGRTRKDGVQVKWKVTRPEFSDSTHTPDDTLFPGGRLDSPFFCHDVTERGVRVPFDDPEKSDHPCGATGILAVEVLVPESTIDSYVKLYSNVLHSVPIHEQGVKLDLGLPVAQMGRSALRVLPAVNEEHGKWLRERGIGIFGLAIHTEGREGHGKERLGSEGSPYDLSLEW